MQLAVDASHVHKTYQGHNAVTDLSLAVPTGTVYGLMGPNGAGKTTAIRMLLDIIRPDSGRIQVLGLPSSHPELRGRVGYLPEERGLYRRMKVRNVLRFLGEIRGMRGRALDARIDEWLTRLGLKGEGVDWSDRRVEQLSRGMQQKVQFIGALLHDPELVILDEPFSGLDPLNAQVMKDTVVELRRTGRTILFSTHMMDNAERMCDAVCIIAGGRKVIDGPVSEIKRQHGDRTFIVEFERSPETDIAALLAERGIARHVENFHRYLEIELHEGVSGRALMEAVLCAGGEVRRFERVQPSLHRVFVQAVGSAAAHVEEGVSGHG